MNSKNPQNHAPGDMVSTLLDMMSIACLLMTSLGFWVLKVTSGADPAFWILVTGWYFLLTGSATLVAIYRARFVRGDLHSKLQDTLS